MKRFKHYLKEEWVDETPFVGNIWKNPTSREWSEYFGTIEGGIYVQGFLHGKDLYIFDKGLHEQALNKLGISRESVTEFRCKVGTGKKLYAINATGGPMLHKVTKKITRKKTMDDLKKVYNHKSIKRYWNSDDEVVWGEIVRRIVQLALGKKIKDVPEKMAMDQEVRYLAGLTAVKPKLSPEEIRKRLGLKEEWVDQTNRLGDVYKNPSSRELKEIGSSAEFGDLAGLMVDNDVYVFSGAGLHDDALKLLSKKGVSGKVFRFRGTISKSGKIEELLPTGAFRGAETPRKRKKLFDDMMKVYNHKSLKRNMEDVRDVMYPIRSIFGNYKAYKEFQELMDKVEK